MWVGMALELGSGQKLEECLWSMMEKAYFALNRLFMLLVRTQKEVRNMVEKHTSP